ASARRWRPRGPAVRPAATRERAPWPPGVAWGARRHRRSRPGGRSRRTARGRGWASGLALPRRSPDNARLRRPTAGCVCVAVSCAASCPGHSIQTSRGPRRASQRAAMKIYKDRVVRFHYTVSEAGQAPLESSKERGEPLAILAGHGNVIPGLDKALDGHEAGDSFGVDVPAAEAYGERRDGLTQRVPKKHFGAQKLAP